MGPLVQAVIQKCKPPRESGLAATAFAFYLLTFTYEIANHTDSAHERRASDWTMPTWAEGGHTKQIELIRGAYSDAPTAWAR